MSRTSFVKGSRFACRALQNSTVTRTAFRSLPAIAHSALHLASATRRGFSLSAPFHKGIMPDTETPGKEQSTTPTPPSYGAVELSESEYHDLADVYLDGVLTQFEALQDSRDDIDIEFSAGVMTITHTDKGTYVINKQPPNKQIWLSSPLSGPKRYDWCVIGEGQNDKEGTGQGGRWIYTRDGSSLNELILEELDVDLSTTEN